MITLEWISLQKELPPFNESILLAVKDAGVMVGYFSKYSHKFFSGDNRYYKDEVTHWMPLPTNPDDDL